MCQENCNCSGNSNSLWFPPSSTLKPTVNQDDPTNLFVVTNIIPPRGFKYVGYDDTSTLRISSSGISVKCTVCKDPTTGIACSPTISGENYTCEVQGDCKTCDKPTVTKLGDSGISFDTGGFVNYTQGVSFITSDTQNKNCIPAAFPAMFEVQEIQNQMNDFKTRVYDGQPDPIMTNIDGYTIAPEGYTIAAINVFGRAAWLPIPVSAVTDRLICGATASCDCSTHKKEGDPNCQKHHEPNNSFATCYGDCTGDCTLTLGKVTPLGEFEPVFSSTVYTL